MVDQQAVVEVMKAFRAEITRVVSDLVGPLQEATKRYIAPILEEMARMVLDLPDRTRHLLTTLAENGWYIDLEMAIPEVSRWEELLRAGHADEAHAFLIAYFDEKCEEICKRLCTTFPMRERILGAAFKAHKDRQFALSVPVFLAQADGICLKLMGVQLYSRRKVADAAATLDIDDITTAFLHPLTEVFPIIFGPQQRGTLPDSLNRHAVLHGESTDYNTLQNSCKAISLLAFTAWILADVKKDALDKAHDAPADC